MKNKENIEYIDVPFSVICRDADDRPLAIEEENWIASETMYTVVDVKQDLISGEKGCYILLEVKPNEPYKGFMADRFEVCMEISPN